MWEKTNNYYNREVVKCDVWSYKVSENTTIYLMDSKEDNFMFTVSAGPHSDRSYTGCFFGHKEVQTLQDAMEGIKKMHPNYFR